MTTWNCFQFPFATYVLLLFPVIVEKWLRQFRDYLFYWWKYVDNFWLFLASSRYPPPSHFREIEISENKREQ